VRAMLVHRTRVFSGHRVCIADRAPLTVDQNQTTATTKTRHVGIRAPSSFQAQQSAACTALVPTSHASTTNGEGREKGPPAVCVLQVQPASCVQTQLTDHWAYTSSACMYGPPAELSPYLVTPCLLRGVNRWPRLVHFLYY
jgi:hypothetical protein